MVLSTVILPLVLLVIRGRIVMLPVRDMVLARPRALAYQVVLDAVQHLFLVLFLVELDIGEVPPREFLPDLPGELFPGGFRLFLFDGVRRMLYFCFRNLHLTTSCLSRC